VDACGGGLKVVVEWFAGLGRSGREERILNIVGDIEPFLYPPYSVVLRRSTLSSRS
jgi:hypothetical protein